MLKEILDMCFHNNVELLYLTRFGSHLYGTNTPESDTDYKGIFLPSKEQCFMQEVPKSLQFSSGGNDKNTKDDVDVQLWSLQYFLQLVSKGETNALDLLFSFTNPDMIVWKSLTHGIMDTIFSNTAKLFDIRNCNAYVGYAIGQAKKYGIKGSRLGVLKNVLNITTDIIEHHLDSETTLENIIDIIIDKCFDSSYCFKKNIKGKNFLVLCGKTHQCSITTNEFYIRIKREYDKYGKRAEQAEKNEGIDWKALSHAVRALVQMKQLILTGFINYPLIDAVELSNIKRGNTTFFDVEKRIYDDIEKIDTMLKKPNLIVHNKRDDKFIRSIIIDAYEELSL